VLAAVPLAAWCALALALPATRPPASAGPLALWLALVIGGGALVFWGGSALLGGSERTALWGMLPGRRTR
jgi:hypothetical protein